MNVLGLKDKEENVEVNEHMMVFDYDKLKQFK